MHWIKAVFPVLLFIAFHLSAAEPERHLYKEIDGHELYLHCFSPDGHNPPKDRKPAIVFFFGGGWVGGTPKQFYPQC